MSHGAQQLTCTLRNQRESSIHDRIDDKRSTVVSDVDEELVPALRLICLKWVSTRPVSVEKHIYIPGASGK